jgi:protein disulfide-isomerase A1
LKKWDEAFKGKEPMIFVTSGIKSGINQYLGEYFGIKEMQLP